MTTQLQILKLLKELAARFDVSMLLVTHDFGVIAQLCDRVIIMYAGQTAEYGPTGDIIDARAIPTRKCCIRCHPDRSDELIGIPGQVPVPVSPPSGCRFHPRCPAALDACRAARPPLLYGEADRQAVACVLYSAERCLMPKVLVELQDVSTTFTTSPEALPGQAAPDPRRRRRVSLTLMEGEILGVVGESGCGKSTLARTILGLQRETAGQIVLDGSIVSGLPARHAASARRDIQYVHQDPGAALDPWWRVGASLDEVAEDRRRCRPGRTRRAH